ncbi:MAG: M1 family metallopeptidase, partial [Flavobacteriales bacterium]|nr:M1 family metallopeptidase [Flavobacteriales bacterium]
DLKYSYENDKITIQLDRAYQRSEEFQVFIEYTAKPNELEVEGSNAISDAKGLYFINNKNEEEDKPQQIWTQGETESNSCWFPTIDKPNERMTQEIYITIENKFLTISNGLLIYSTDNGDGTRTDYWKQDQNHAPYLAMMAIGEYAVIKDQWRDIEVNYYVEQEYEPYAKAIFGNTPEMLQFYSDLLGVDYPWAKYSQVVVRDYVSGAMENTTAVIHGEFLQRDDRELLDGTNEDVVAHELFHHWFGDLVTCESWANLPLNESFATYGEYLWNEYKYGRDEADYGLNNDLNSYLWASEKKQVDIVRFDYDDKEDMFDSHSYAKGGRVLHMLRKYVGDEAFFASLKLYLNRHQYTAVEIHELRLAFEKITGEDLNWFFNQWFLSSGHPDLIISQEYVDSTQQVLLTISQAQDMESTPLYRLPLEVDIYAGGTVTRHSIVSDSIRKTYVLKSATEPDLVNVDAEKMLICVKKDYKSFKEWVFMYRNAPRFMDRLEAINELKTYTDDPKAFAVIEEALNDKHWKIRLEATQSLREAAKRNDNNVKEKLIDLAKNDEKSAVRRGAIASLSTYYHPDSVAVKDEKLKDVYKEAMSDESYRVNGAALAGLSTYDFNAVVEMANAFDEKTAEKLRLTVAQIYGDYGTTEHNVYFTSLLPKLSVNEKFRVLKFYNSYLLRQNDEIILEGVQLLEESAYKDEIWWSRLTTVYRIKSLANLYEERAEALDIALKDKKNTEEEIANLSREQAHVQRQALSIKETLTRIKSKEKDEKVLQFWDGAQQ